MRIAEKENKCSKFGVIVSFLVFVLVGACHFIPPTSHPNLFMVGLGLLTFPCYI